MASIAELEAVVLKGELGDIERKYKLSYAPAREATTQNTKKSAVLCPATIELNEIKEEKISIIKNMIIPNILKNYDITLDNCNAIEIGPGAGIMLDWLAPQINHIYCIDISKTILESCYNENKQHKIPHEILISHNFDDIELVANVISEKAKRKIKSTQDKIDHQFECEGPLSFLKRLATAQIDNPYTGRKIV